MLPLFNPEALAALDADPDLIELAQRAMLRRQREAMR